MIAYQCERTGLLFPEELYEKWGIDGLGVGLGPKPVSEALVSCYDKPPVGDGENVMHPLAMCQAPLARVDVSQSNFDSQKAILMRDDKSMVQRAKIMRDKQVLKSPKLKQVIAAAKA